MMAGIQSTVAIDQSILWQPANEAVRGTGLSMTLFAGTGAGKSTFCAGPHTLFFDFEGGTDVLGDRSDILVWPPKDSRTGNRIRPTWDGFLQVNEAVWDAIDKGDRPADTFVFDTANKWWDLACAKVLKGAKDSDGVPLKREWDDYRKVNAMVNEVIYEWCLKVKETGINVVFTTHAREVKRDDNVVLIRMDLPPEVITEFYEDVDCIGYLENVKDKRKLYLHNTKTVVAKYRQTQTGPQLPLELGGDENPSLHKILEFRKKALNGHTTNK